MNRTMCRFVPSLNICVIKSLLLAYGGFPPSLHALLRKGAHNQDAWITADETWWGACMLAARYSTSLHKPQSQFLGHRRL